MPFAVCNRCIVYYVVEREEPGRHECRDCKETLHPCTRDEALAHLHQAHRSSRAGAATRCCRSPHGMDA